MTLMVILAAAEERNIEIQHRIEDAYVAELMLSLIEEETGRLRSIQNNPNAEDSTDAYQHDDSTSSVLVLNVVHTSNPSPPNLYHHVLHLCHPLQPHLCSNLHFPHLLLPLSNRHLPLLHHLHCTLTN